MNPLGRRGPRAAWVLPCAAAALAMTMLAGCSSDDDDDDLPPVAEAPQPEPPAPEPEAPKTCLQLSDTGELIDPLAPPADGAPEIGSGYASKGVVYARTYMAIAANPIATKVACDVLARGGSAVDAAVATQMVLNLVEPQSSGIGGGAFLMHYDAATKTVVAYDGRETAPAAATGNYLRWISDTEQTTPQPGARASGRSIGTPGTLHMLDAAHRDHGKLSWKELFEPAIRIADEGFAISPRMSASIAGSRAQLARDAEARDYFLNADGSAKAAGTLLESPALAQTFRAVAENGIQAFYTGEIAQDIVDEIADTTGGITPGLTTLEDLAAYESKRREAVCTHYRQYLVCGMPPPSSGGLTVASALGVLENFDLGRFGPSAVDREGGRPSPFGVHLVIEAERLAYADRNKYMADTDFVPLPGGNWNSLLDKNYLRQRANLIDFTATMGVAAPGDLGPVPLGISPAIAERGTSHVSIVDKEGNVVALTTTIEGGFGSFHMTRGGFLLNNELTDFSADPVDGDGNPIANAVAPGKRPRSSMAPTLVFLPDADGRPGEFVMATGSPGGAAIIQYVVKTLVGTLDWKLDPQQAISMINFGTSNGPSISVGGEHPHVDTSNGGDNDPLITGLRAFGHTVSTGAQTSGLGSIVRTTVGGEPAYAGGADPRREGIVLGDTFVP
ncbi:MAG TPA: gamma-glutamyltransferase [Burkholderiaceae bacterium]|nr:gamma-glutamyltransferase [Burkholderiaceae bacterium]